MGELDVSINFSSERVLRNSKAVCVQGLGSVPYLGASGDKTYANMINCRATRENREAACADIITEIATTLIKSLAGDIGVKAFTEISPDSPFRNSMAKAALDLKTLLDDIDNENNGLQD